MPHGHGREISRLSDTLNALGRTIFGSADRDATFRNPNGVYMKMMNFRALDPEFTGRGRRGLTRGAKKDAAVWDEFSGDSTRCAGTAAAILSAARDGALSVDTVASAGDDFYYDAPEGKLLSRLHCSRERNRTLVKNKFKKVLSEAGSLSCEVCGFDFSQRYGEVGEGFAECHHLRPVSSLVDGSRTRLEELAVVCANCHRMIHRRRPWISLQVLRESLHVICSTLLR